MTIANCLELPAPPTLPPLTIPNFGILQTARQSLYDMPDLSNYIMRLQDTAAVALAPLRRMLEIMEVLLAFKQCMQAVPAALLPPSPKPILDCLKSLVKAFTLLLQYIPPFNYIPTLIDLMDYVIVVIDEIVAFFQLLDDRITEQKVELEAALELGDLELASIIDCVSAETTQLIVNAMDILKFIQPLITTMLDPLSRLIPVAILKEKLEELADIPSALVQIQTDIEATAGIPVITPLLQVMYIIRNVAVVVANTVAPLVGKAASREPEEAPVFVNF